MLLKSSYDNFQYKIMDIIVTSNTKKENSYKIMLELILDR